MDWLTTNLKVLLKTILWALFFALLGYLLYSKYHIQIESFFGKLDGNVQAALVGGAIVLLVFIMGNIVIPLIKYSTENNSRRQMLLAVMETIVDQILYPDDINSKKEKHVFLKENIETDILANQYYQNLANPHDKAKDEPNYMPYIYSTSHDALIEKVLNDDYFWLMGKTTTRLFAAYDSNSSTLAETCAVAMDDKYVQITAHDRERYVKLLGVVKDVMGDCVRSAIELKIHLVSLRNPVEVFEEYNRKFKEAEKTKLRR